METLQYIVELENLCILLYFCQIKSYLVILLVCCSIHCAGAVQDVQTFQVPPRRRTARAG